MRSAAYYIMISTPMHWGEGEREREMRREGERGRECIAAVPGGPKVKVRRSSKDADFLVEF